MELDFVPTHEETDMAWLEENETKGQEQYRMDRVADHRKQDTTPKSAEEVDGTHTAPKHVDEFTVPHGPGTSLEDTYGERNSGN